MRPAVEDLIGKMLMIGIFAIMAGRQGISLAHMLSSPVRPPMWVLGAFIAYQVYRYSFTHSTWLIVLTALDVVVIALIHHEYRLRKRHGFPG